MAFIKDAETKIYKDKEIKSNNEKVASKKEKVRYTVDDLVRDTEDAEDEVVPGDKHVSN